MQQYFNDRNHRTALLFCYFYYLINNKILKIKPYQLFAAINYQVNCIHNEKITNDVDHLCKVLTSAKYSSCKTSEQLKKFTQIRNDTLHLHITMDRLLKSYARFEVPFSNTAPGYKQLNIVHQQQMKSYARFGEPLRMEKKMGKPNLPILFPA